jgi:hypothetical protein
MFTKALFYLAFVLLISPVSAQNILPLSAEKTLILCAEMAHPFECGRSIEKEQLLLEHKKWVRRDGKKLNLTLSDKKIKTLSDKGDEEEGEGFHFSAYYEECDCYLIFTTVQKDRDNKEQDKTAYLLIERGQGKETSLPNEPRFADKSKRLLTLDVCPEGCEQKLAVWEWLKDQFVRTQELAIAARWTEVSAEWKDGGRIELVQADARDQQKLLLTLGDSRWKRLK